MPTGRITRLMATSCPSQVPLNTLPYMPDPICSMMTRLLQWLLPSEGLCVESTTLLRSSSTFALVSLGRPALAWGVWGPDIGLGSATSETHADPSSPSTASLSTWMATAAGAPGSQLLLSPPGSGVPVEGVASPFLLPASRARAGSSEKLVAGLFMPSSFRMLSGSRSRRACTTYTAAPTSARSKVPPMHVGNMMARSLVFISSSAPVALGSPVGCLAPTTAGGC
mmetsp:Transcript_36334/g.80858  ORF Transcript_36334/g.80858 Transcript_36334/m.80858 type:complete len:225 (-) Transcript_36334:973-1647(-)